LRVLTAGRGGSPGHGDASEALETRDLDIAIKAAGYIRNIFSRSTFRVKSTRLAIKSENSDELREHSQK